MHILAFLFYCVLFLLVLYKLTHKKALLSTGEMSLAFLFKVALGCLYGYIYQRYYHGDDTWNNHLYSVEELHKLRHNTWHYFTELLPAETFAWAGGNFFHGFSAYLHTLEIYCIVKYLSIANIFSGSNYYINVVFFNFMLFWGPYWLFSLLVKELPDKRKPLLWLVFFFPPLVFWLSGIRADGVILFFLALLLLHFRRWLYEHERWSLLYIMIGMLGVVIYRSQVMLLLLPALAAWFISVKYNRKPVTVYWWVYAISGLLFFASAWVSPAQNLPGVIVDRQQAFFKLHGTRLPLDSLQPTVTSFVKVLPQSLSHTFVRPTLWEAKGALQLMTAVEISIFWLLTALAIIKRDIYAKRTLRQPFILFCMAFGITLYIFIGYVVPFPGAIVRYKAVPELLLLCVAMSCTNWHALHRINKKVYI